MRVDRSPATGSPSGAPGPRSTTDRAERRTVRDRLEQATVRTKVWLELDGRFVIGEGGMHLLSNIHERGSLVAAARAIGWSYRHAWGYLRRAEEVLGAPLTVARPGRGAARGTELTGAGRALLDLLASVRARLDETVGPGGPTAEEIAARGRASARGRRGPRADPSVRNPVRGAAGCLAGPTPGPTAVPGASGRRRPRDDPASPR